MIKEKSVMMDGHVIENVTITTDEAQIILELDSTIKSVCVRIRENNTFPEEYPDTVMALAALVEARAKLV